MYYGGICESRKTSLIGHLSAENRKKDIPFNCFSSTICAMASIRLLPLLLAAALLALMAHRPCVAQGTPSPTQKTPNRPKTAIPPPRPPKLVQPVEGMQWVDGIAADHTHAIVVKISSSSGVMLGRTQDPVWPDIHDDKFTAGFLYTLKAGDIVQAFVIDGGREVNPSPPVPVSSKSKDSANPQESASKVTPGSGVQASVQAAAQSAAQAAAEARSAAEEAIHARSAAEARAAVAIAIAAADRAAAAAHEAKTMAKAAPPEAAADSPAAGTADDKGSGKKRKDDSAVEKKQSCDKSEPTNEYKQEIKLSAELRDNANEIKGSVPEGGGTVAVCVGSEMQSIAAEATPKEITQTVALAKTDMDVVLSTPLKINQDVLISWVSKDKKRRIVLSKTVAAAQFGSVVLQAVPKEGQNKVLVDTPGMPAESTGKGACVAAPTSGGKTAGTAATPAPNCLRVYVNGEPVTLTADDKGTQADAVAVDPSGSQGITLKTPLDAGECVAVVAFPYGHPPAFVSHENPKGLDASYLKCSPEADGRSARQPPRVGPGHIGDGFSVSPSVLTTSYFDFGRVRGYIAGGSLFSYDANSFSTPSIFMELNVTKNWRWGGPYFETDVDPDTHWVDVHEGYKRVMFETFFDTRLTSLPVAACNQTASSSGSTTPTVTPGTGTTATQTAGSGACPNTPESFVSSRKAAALNAGASIPIVVSTWKYLHQPYALTLGPLAKIGLDTPLSSGLVSGVAANSHQFYTNFGFGGRISLYRMSYSTAVAPESIMYMDVVAGRYSNFDVSPTDPTLRYARPYRFGFEGILKVPSTPFFLGFSANIHQNFGLGDSKTVNNAKDDLRFLFGAKFDAGKLFSGISMIH